MSLISGPEAGHTGRPQKSPLETSLVFVLEEREGGVSAVVPVGVGGQLLSAVLVCGFWVSGEVMRCRPLGRGAARGYVGRAEQCVYTT